MLSMSSYMSATSYIRAGLPSELAKSFPFWLCGEGYCEAAQQMHETLSAEASYLLVYTVSGSGTLTVGGKLRQLSAGYATLVDCREGVELCTVSKETWCFHFVYFDSLVMEGYKRLLLDEFVTRRVSERLRFVRYLERIHDLASEENEMLRYALFSDLTSGLLLILGNSQRTVEGQRDVDSEAVHTACRYIEENLRGDVSIDQLASLVHLSKFYFIRLFKRLMGVSPYQYLQTTRINSAKDLLLKSDFRINEIADAVGFSSATRFTRFFSESVGVSPSEFRKSTHAEAKELDS